MGGLSVYIIAVFPQPQSMTFCSIPTLGSRSCIRDEKETVKLPVANPPPATAEDDRGLMGTELLGDGDGFDSAK